MEAMNEHLVRCAAAVYCYSFADPFTMTKHRYFVRVSRFGVEPTMVAMMWDISITQTNFSSGAKLVHLLWSLNFLKIFDSVHGFFGVDEKTYRQWMWPIIQCIASMSVVHKKEKYGWLLCFIG
jgi:hypothetical protein